MYYPIDETLARRANDAYSFSDYETGSTTAAYRAAVDDAAALVESRKAAVSPYYHDKLDGLLDAYARRLAAWYNDHNRNTAACPSVMICGPANFPTHKKAKQNAREDALMREYNEINGLLDKIRTVGTGPVDLADPHARELLQDRLDRLQADLDRCKALNAHWRKHKTFAGFPDLTPEAAAKLDADFAETVKRAPFHGKPCPDYELASLRDRIKRTQARLADLDALQAAQATPAESTKFDGGEIVRNAEQNRLQIVFDAIPDADTRQALKSNGFHWSPRNQAWQRQLTPNAEAVARSVLGI